MMNGLRCIWILIAVQCSLRLAAQNSGRWSVIDIRSYASEPLNKVLFTNDRVGWVSAGRNTLLKTVDGGRTWSVLRTNLTEPTSEISGIWFTNENHGWAVGSTDRRPAVWSTHDGGSTWAVARTWPIDLQPRGGLLDIYFSDETHGWAVGFNGSNAVIVNTRDAGKHWETQCSGTEITAQFSKVRFSDSHNGWALSLDAVMQTRDGGQSWQLRHFDSGLLNDLESKRFNEAWVAGGWGRVMHTVNGVKFVSPERGWVSGVKCEIFSTRNSGKTWVMEECPLPLDLRSEIDTGEMSKGPGKLYIIANPGRVLVRPTD